MKTIKDLIRDETIAKKFDEIKTVIGVRKKRSALYDINTICNLKCKGCFYYSSRQDAVQEETDPGKIAAFIEAEKAAGISYAILIGGEPSLSLDRLALWYDCIKCTVATNGIEKIPRERFPDLRIGVSLWGEGEVASALKGVDTFSLSMANYRGDPNVYYIYTINPHGVHQIRDVVRKIHEAGLKVYFQLFCNDQGLPGLDWTQDGLKAARDGMDAALDAYPKTLLSCHYYHQVLTTQEMLGRRFGWMVCRPCPKRWITGSRNPSGCPGSTPTRRISRPCTVAVPPASAAAKRATTAAPRCPGSS